MIIKYKDELQPVFLKFNLSTPPLTMFKHRQRKVYVQIQKCRCKTIEAFFFYHER